MLFTIFILISVSLAIGFTWLYRILISIRKRYKSIDTRLHNLHGWAITGNDSIVQQLENIKEIVSSLHAGAKIIDIKKTNEVESAHSSRNRPVVQKKTDVFYNREQRISSLYYREDSLTHAVKDEEVKYYYLAILEEIQYLHKIINTLQEA